jgi:hypothetical protein
MKMTLLKTSPKRKHASLLRTSLMAKVPRNLGVEIRACLTVGLTMTRALPIALLTALTKADRKPKLKITLMRKLMTLLMVTNRVRKSK